MHKGCAVRKMKMFGFLKPKFYSIYDKSVEDFGVLCIDHAI